MRKVSNTIPPSPHNKKHRKNVYIAPNFGRNSTSSSKSNSRKCSHKHRRRVTHDYEIEVNQTLVSQLFNTIHVTLCFITFICKRAQVLCCPFWSLYCPVSGCLLAHYQKASLCNLSIGQVSDFREIFRQIDIDNNGSIDESELKLLLASIHTDDEVCPENYIKELIKKVKNIQQEGSPHVDDGNNENLEFTVPWANHSLYIFVIIITIIITITIITIIITIITIITIIIITTIIITIIIIIIITIVSLWSLSYLAVVVLSTLTASWPHIAFFTLATHSSYTSTDWLSVPLSLCLCLSLSLSFSLSLSVSTSLTLLLFCSLKNWCCLYSKDRLFLTLKKKSLLLLTYSQVGIAYVHDISHFTVNL